MAIDIFLTKIKLCQVYTCFEYLSVSKLYKLLPWVVYNIEYTTMEMMIKSYHYC